MRKVNYYGRIYTVRDDTNYIAIDKNSDIYEFVNAPFKGVVTWLTDGEIYYTGGWDLSSDEENSYKGLWEKSLSKIDDILVKEEPQDEKLETILKKFSESYDSGKRFIVIEEYDSINGNDYCIMVETPSKEDCFQDLLEGREVNLYTIDDAFKKALKLAKESELTLYLSFEAVQEKS